MSEMSEMSEIELLKKELLKKDQELESFKEEIKQLKENISSKKAKVEEVDLEKALQTLQSNFSTDWAMISAQIKSLYLADVKDTKKRRAHKLAQMGILWTEIVKYPEIFAMISGDKRFSLLQETFVDLKVVDYWARIGDSTKSAILEWLGKLRISPLVKPEALISGNLWGYIIRKIILSIENSCCVMGHTNRTMLQCFGEYDMDSLKSMGTKFYTDIVFTAGCRGLPLLLVELQASKHLFRTKKPPMHKDLKKLAVQMSAALFELIGMVRKHPRLHETFKLSDLRVFGALIFDSQIEYYVSKPVIQEGDKFFIIFESCFNHGNMYKNDNYGETIDDSDVDYDSEYEEEEIPYISPATLTEATEFDDTMPPGPINLECLKSLTNFLGMVHEYYSKLDASLIELYLSPHSHEKDKMLVYPDIIHKNFKTSSGYTPQLQQRRMHEFYSTSGERIPTTSHVFATLPIILGYHDDGVTYLEGVSLPEVEQSIDANDKDLAIQRTHSRAALILDIFMGVFMASKSGFVFERFNLSDITFRNGIYCIKSYDNAVSISEMPLLDSLDAFSRFYKDIYYMDRIMMKGDPEYAILNSLEAIVFRKLKQFRKGSPTDSDYLDLFKMAKKKYEEILDEILQIYQYDSTWVLLQNLSESFQSLPRLEPVKKCKLEKLGPLECS